MAGSHLNDGDSFRLALNSGDRHYLFVRRVSRQVASGSDNTFFETLQALGVGSDVAVGDIHKADMDKLISIQEEMSALILDICARKAGRDKG